MDLHKVAHNCEVEGQLYMVLKTFDKEKSHKKALCAVYSSPLSRYSVQPPYAETAAASLLGYFSTSFAHVETAILAHSSLSSSSVRLDGERL